MRRNKNKRSKANKRGKKRAFNVETVNDEMIVFAKGPNPLPARYQTSLKYQSNSVIRNAASVFANSVFTPTYVYDLDPLLGSTAVPYLSELAKLYRFYRLIGYSCTVDFTNLDSTSAGTVYVCPLNVNPGPNSLLYQSYLSNPRSKSAIIGISTGKGSAGPLKIAAGVDEFGGVKWTGQSDVYAAQTDGSTIPTNNMYVAIGYLCTPAMGNGLVANVTLRLRVEFFEFTTPPT